MIRLEVDPQTAAGEPQIEANLGLAALRRAPELIGQLSLSGGSNHRLETNLRLDDASDVEAQKRAYADPVPDSERLFDAPGPLELTRRRVLISK